MATCALGSVALAGSLFFPWSQTGNLSVVSPLRIWRLAFQVDTDVPLPILVGVPLLLLAALVTVTLTSTAPVSMHMNGRNVARWASVLAVSLAVGWLWFGPLAGEGWGSGKIAAATGLVCWATDIVLGLRGVETGPPRGAAWAPAIAAGVIVLATTLGVMVTPGIGASSAAAARSGFIVALQSDDTYGAATYVLPSDIHRVGRATAAVGQITGMLGMDDLLSGADMLPSFVSDALELMENEIPTGLDAGRHFVSIPR